MKTGVRVLVRLSCILFFVLSAVSVRSQAILWQQPFESGWGGWYSNLGTWEVGTAANGPPNGAHSGANCAGTKLSGTPAAWASSRLISPPFVVPAARANPRLRFWQWYSTTGSTGYGQDSGLVEIMAGTNSWKPISPDYYGSTSGDWTRPFVDLTAYAGHSVTLAFHCSGSGQPGPLVTMVAPAVNPAPALPPLPDLRSWPEEKSTAERWLSAGGFSAKSTLTSLFPCTTWAAC